MRRWVEVERASLVVDLSKGYGSLIRAEMNLLGGRVMVRGCSSWSFVMRTADETVGFVVEMWVELRRGAAAAAL